MFFKACIGRDACNEDGDHCRACGRPHSEIEKTRRIVADLADFILEMGYENYDEFLEYLRRKTIKKYEHLLDKNNVTGQS